MQPYSSSTSDPVKPPSSEGFQEKKSKLESRNTILPKIEIPRDTAFPESKVEKIVKKEVTSQQIDDIKNFYKKTVEKEKYSEDFVLQHPIYDHNKIIGAYFGEVLTKQALTNQDADSHTINLQYLGWVLNMAMFALPQKETLDDDTKRALEFAILNSWRKSAPVDTNSSNISSQKSPLMQESKDYYRFYSKIHKFLNELYCQRLRVEVYLIDSSLIKEIFYRENPQHIKINSPAELEKFLEEITSSRKYGDERIFIDLSSMIDRSKFNEDKNYLPKLKGTIRKIIIDKILSVDLSSSKFRSPQEVMFQIQPFAFFDYLDQPLVINFKSSDDEPIDRTFRNYILDTNTKYGFFPNPEQSLLNLLRFNDTSAYKVLKEFNQSFLFKTKYDVSAARLVTGEERKLPVQSLATDTVISVPNIQEDIGTVFESWEDFTTCSTFKQFESLGASETKSPYLKILPSATAALLKGLDDRLIDKTFKDKGLGDVLQMSYYLMRQAMGEAIFRKDNFAEFNGCIELIHQQIQNVFAFIQPYNLAQLESVIREEIPKDIGDVRVHLKSSGMRCIASFLGAIESLKGTNALNVVVQKDSYFEHKKIFETVKTYNQSILDGDLFRKDPESAVASINKPVDLFVCEFRHNMVFHDRHSYFFESVKDQIIALYDKNLAGDQMTVAIDCTISDSGDLRDLLEDSKIKDYMEKRQLNLVFYRSAQKFDMLGMDNYYGGILTTVNNTTNFSQYNSRMDDPQDQLGGIHLQGLTHLHKYAAAYLDQFKKQVMSSTKMFYKKLPQEAIWKENTRNPIQILQNHDDKAVFIHIQFKEYPETLKSVVNGFKKLARENDLIIEDRVSFGFPTTNLYTGTSDLRLTLGLESEETLDLFANYFKQVQEEINKKGDQCSDQELAQAIIKKNEDVG